MRFLLLLSCIIVPLGLTPGVSAQARRGHRTLLPSHLSLEQVTPQGPSCWEQEELYSYRVSELQRRSRAWQRPAVAAAVGVASLLVGAALFRVAWSADDGFNPAMDRAGLVMMPVGALVTLVSVPLFGARLKRALHLQDAENALQWLQGCRP